MEITSVYINPLTDFGFKQFFGTPANKQNLISFLNSLHLVEEEIIEIEYLDKEQIGETPVERTLIYDIFCSTVSGHNFIVEMQNRYQDHFRDRALYYLSSQIRKQGQKGRDWDYSIMPVYGVFIMNFPWRDNMKPKLCQNVMLMDIDDHEIFTDRLRMVFIQLPLLEKTADECQDTFSRWIYILKNMENMNIMPASFMNDPVFRDLDNTARVSALSEAELSRYERSLMAYRDQYAFQKTEERTRQKIREEGIVEGIAIGEERGIAIGEERGIAIGKERGIAIGEERGIAIGEKRGAAKAEMRRNCDVAKALLSLGMDYAQVASISHLSVEEVIALQNEISDEV